MGNYLKRRMMIMLCYVLGGFGWSLQVILFGQKGIFGDGGDKKCSFWYGG